VGPRTLPGHTGEEKKNFFMPGIEPQFLGPLTEGLYIFYINTHTHTHTLTYFLLRKTKGKGEIEDQDVVEKIILVWILRNLNGRT
jgi:hypothetical protein